MTENFNFISLTFFILSVLFIYLSKHVIDTRRKFKVRYGDGGHRELQAAIRAHGNFCEYTPFAAILLILFAQQETNQWILAILCLLLIAGRITHAYGIIKLEAAEPPNFKARVIGMYLTFAVLIISAIFLLILSFM